MADDLHHELPAVPAVVTVGGVFVPGWMCEPIWRVLRAELTRRRNDGGQIRPEMNLLLDALKAGKVVDVWTCLLRGIAEVPDDCRLVRVDVDGSVSPAHAAYHDRRVVPGRTAPIGR
jgi:hypothetical protein